MYSTLPDITDYGTASCVCVELCWHTSIYSMSVSVRSGKFPFMVGVSSAQYTLWSDIFYCIFTTSFN